MHLLVKRNFEVLQLTFVVRQDLSRFILTGKGRGGENNEDQLLTFGPQLRTSRLRISAQIPFIFFWRSFCLVPSNRRYVCALKWPNWIILFYIFSSLKQILQDGTLCS